MRKYKVLSIDWDWVTGDCAQACLHAHCGWCNQFSDEVTEDSIRGEGEALSLNRVRDNSKALVYMLRRLVMKEIKPTTCYVAESHADIYFLLKPGDEVWNIDAHTDDVDCGTLCCGSWANCVNTVYVKTHNVAQNKVGDDLKPSDAINKVRSFNRNVDFIFLCLSSPFTPKEFDPHFFELCTSLFRRMKIQFVGHKARELKQRWTKYVNYGAW